MREAREDEQPTIARETAQASAREARLAAVVIALLVFLAAFAVVFAIFKFVVRRETQPTQRMPADARVQSTNATRLSFNGEVEI